MGLDAKKREEKSIESKLLRLKYLDWNKIEVKKQVDFFDVQVNGERILRQQQEVVPSRFGFGASGVKAVFKNFKIDIIREWKQDQNQQWQIPDENKEAWFKRVWKRIYAVSVPRVKGGEAVDDQEAKVKSEDTDYINWQEHTCDQFNDRKTKASFCNQEGSLHSVCEGNFCK